MATVDRRTVLKGMVAAASAPALGTRPAASAGPDRFPWGVASFDPTSDGVLLWTRLATDAPQARVRWRVAADGSLREPVASGEVVVRAEDGHCTTVDVAGLEPGRTWWYGFEADGATSAVGRTRTMPVDPVERLRLGVVSCSRFAAGGFAAYRALADREVDLVVHLGDYIYEDGGAEARAHDPPEELRTLDQYRRRYAQHRQDPDLQALHARHPMVAVWDDHELADNAWRDGARAHGSADGAWADRRRAATTAHEEWVPGRTRPGEAGVEVWRALPLGPAVELLVLDTRSWRDRQAQGAAELEAGTGRTLLGSAQRDWLLEQLDRPDRPPWTLLANQVMFHPLRVPVPAGVLASQIEDAGFLVSDGVAVNPDQWDGYAAERDAVAAAMGPRGGVVVLTGDVHSSWAWEGPAGDDAPAMVELVAPSITSEPFGERLPAPPSLVQDLLTGLDDDLSYVELSQHGYVVVEVTDDAVQGEWWFVEPDDPASQAFGAARQAPRAAPMHLTEVAEPLPDPVPTTQPAPTATTTPTTAPANGGGDAELELGPVAAAAAALTAAVAAALAVRRRRA